LDQATHGTAFPRWNTHNRQCTVVVDPPRFLLDRGSTISMLAPSCPGIKLSSVWGTKWRAQRGLAHRCQPQRRLARWRAQRREATDEVESRLRCGGASIHRKCAHLDRRLWSRRWAASIHRSQLMTIEVASPIRSECAVASIRPMYPTGRPNE